MEHYLLSIGIPAIAFLIVFRFQINYLRLSKGTSVKIGEILTSDTFNHPLRSADWAILIDYFDRLVEPPLDRLRQLSNATLVTGIAGTMGIFLIKIVLIRIYIPESSEIQIPLELIVGVAIALCSSLLGLIFHLHIVRALGLSQSRVSEKQRELYLKINHYSDDKDITPDMEESGVKFLDGALKFLKEQRTTTSKLDQLLKPQQEISQKMSNFMDSLNEQSRTSQKTITDLEGAIQGMNTYQTKILQDSQELFSDLSHSSKEINENVDQLTKELKALPTAITRALDMSDEFEKQAGRHINELHKMFNEHQGFLSNEIVQNQRQVQSQQIAHLEAALEKVLKIVKGPIESEIRDPLKKVSQQLHNTSQAMKNVSEQFNTDLKQALEKMPEAATEFSSSIQKSSDTFSGISEKLQASTKTIHEIVDDSTTRAFEPLLGDMKDFMNTIRDTHERLSEVVQGLVQLIDDLVQGINKKK